MSAVYKGTVYNSYDEGVYGPAGDLDDLPFTVTFIYDPETLGAFVEQTLALNLVGGGVYDFMGGIYNSPILSATFELAGRSDIFGGGYDYFYHLFDAPTYAYHSAASSDVRDNGTELVGGRVGLYAIDDGTGIPYELSVPFALLNVAPLDDQNRAFNISVTSKVTGLTYNAAGSLLVQSLVVTDESTVSEVPIPAALPLVASGLGALSFLGWRRKRKSSTYTGPQSS